jgi:integrase
MARDVRWCATVVGRVAPRAVFGPPPVDLVHGGVIASAEFPRSPRPRQRRLGFGGARSDGVRDVTVREAGVRWLSTYVPTTRNAKGQRLAEARFARYAYFWLGDIPLSELDGDEIREYRLWLERDVKLSPHTVTHILSDLRCLLRWAVTVNLLERSPFPPRVFPRIAEVPPQGFTAEEVKLLTSFGGHAGFALRFLIGTGLRWAEACRATQDHVRGLLLEVGNTKSGRVRRVPLTVELLSEADVYRYHRFVPYAANSPGSFSRMIRQHSGISDFHVHRCRHTFAMRWLESGGNLAVLQHVLGHRDLSTTMRYARVTDQLIEREADLVDRKLRGVD